MSTLDSFLDWSRTFHTSQGVQFYGPQASGVDRTLPMILMRSFLRFLVHLKIACPFWVRFCWNIYHSKPWQSCTQDFPESIILVSYWWWNFSVKICHVYLIVAPSLEIHKINTQDLIDIRKDTVKFYAKELDFIL